MIEIALTIRLQRIRTELCTIRTGYPEYLGGIAGNH
jgi:hypothetical protein